MSRYKIQQRKDRLAKSVKMIKRRANKENINCVTADARTVAPFTWDMVIDNIGVRIIFTRDVGHHTRGWFENPDYERCFHLSLSFRTPDGKSFLPQNEKIAPELIELFYGSNSKLIWADPVCSKTGVLHHVWNYRLFVDRNWQPIQPPREVYTKEFMDRTEILFGNSSQKTIKRNRGLNIMAIIDTLKNWLKKMAPKKLLHKPAWEYGVAGALIDPDNPTPKRRDKLTGEVQFILWDACEQGHENDFWYPMNPTLWPTFIPGRHLCCGQCKNPIHRNDDANICIECGGQNRRIDL